MCFRNVTAFFVEIVWFRGQDSGSGYSGSWSLLTFCFYFPTITVRDVHAYAIYIAMAMAVKFDHSQMEDGDVFHTFAQKAVITSTRNLCSEQKNAESCTPL